MTDEVKQVVRELIRDLGSPSAALEVAFSEAMKSEREKDLYALSCWRDVKRELRVLIADG